MRKNKRIPALFSFVFLTCSILAQSHTDSPYSMFGLGQLNLPGFDKGRAMGGIGLAFRDFNHINHLNPASYTAFDTMSSVFDFGVMGLFTELETNDLSSTYFSGNLDHFAMGIPLTKWWSASVGILPYSRVGYAVKDNTYKPGVGFIDYLYTGNGGLSQLYLGTAFKFFNTLSFGANFKYIFGYIDLNRSVEFPNKENHSLPRIENHTVIQDFLISLGLQVHRTFSEKYEFTLGLTFDNEARLKAENTVTKTNLFEGSPVSLTDSTVLNPSFVLEQDTRKGTVTVPANIGAGLSLEYNNQILLGIDYYSQNWTGAQFMGTEGSFTKSSSLHAGLQIITDPEALRGYYNLISFRAGGHYTNSYLLLNGNQLKDYGISFGVGLPLRGGKSSFNLAFKTGRRGLGLNPDETLDNNLILEKYKFLGFSITLHDIWFFKRKFD